MLKNEIVKLNYKLKQYQRAKDINKTGLGLYSSSKSWVEAYICSTVSLIENRIKISNEITMLRNKK
jgi:hypothetical protein